MSLSKQDKSHCHEFFLLYKNESSKSVAIFFCLVLFFCDLGNLEMQVSKHAYCVLLKRKPQVDIYETGALVSKQACCVF